ncbi:MAG: hypothetical protein EA402_10130 [Planctomycetota bacterium]|nr:MAG: hypothetical protein EA402_10130 [Planctomycetota bacterium]
MLHRPFRSLALGLVLTAAYFGSPALCPLAATETDPLEAALAQMEDALTRLDARAARLSPRDTQEAQAQLRSAASNRQRSQELQNAANAQPTAAAAEAPPAPAAILERLLQEAGLREGANGAERGHAYVATGSAVVTVPPGQRGHIGARLLAYHQAELLARAAIARSLESTVSSERVSQLSASFGDWDGLLRAEGLNPDDVDDGQRLTTLENAVRRRTSQEASAAISGAITFGLAEGPGPDGGHEIHVALLWSPALAALARQFLGQGDSAQPLPAGMPLASQVPQDTHLLARTMGVQPVIDEHGQRVLLAFGQAPIEAHSNPTVASMRASQAGERAQLEAYALLKEFLHTHTDAQAQQELESLIRSSANRDDGEEEQFTSTLEAFRNSVRAAASEQQLEGVTTLKRWRGEIGGSQLSGVVLAWSPAGQAASRELRQRLSGEAADAPAEAPSPEAGDKARASDGEPGHGRTPGVGTW